MDAKAATLHGPAVLEAVLPLSRLLHYVGFSMAIGSAFAVTIVRGLSAGATGERQQTLELAVAEAIGKVEVPGIVIVLLGGVLAVFANPAVLDAKSGLGTWMFIKLPLVIGLAASAFVKMSGARLVIRERKNGATEAECAKLVARGALLDRASIALGVVILLISAFRYTLFG